MQVCFADNGVICLRSFNVCSHRLSLANMEVRVRRIVMAMASLSAMLAGGRKRASQEMVRKTDETM